MPVSRRAAVAVLDEIKRALRTARGVFGGSPEEVFGKLIRQTLDEVIDGPRTGRYAVLQCEKTEKTYIGTKVEIVVRAELELERRGPLDVRLGGHPVDIRWGLNHKWMIPPENLAEPALLLTIDGKEQSFSVGIVICYAERLGRANRDRKRALNAEGRGAIRWLVNRQRLPQNFIAQLSPSLRSEILAPSTGQARIRKLVHLLPGIPIPRSAVETLARQKDAMRRLRADRYGGLGDFVVLSAKYGGKRIAALGLHRCLQNASS
jgi:hypothetical protein